MGLPSTQRKRKTPFIDNGRLIELLGVYRTEFLKAKEEGKRARMGRELGEAVMKIAENLALHPSFVRYSYKDEMIADAVENCVLYVHNFNPEKSKYAFAYITQICYFAFIRRIEKEKDQGRIKDRSIEEYLHDNQTDPTVVAAAQKLLDNKRAYVGTPSGGDSE